jgi:Ca2+-transporting ATPase
MPLTEDTTLRDWHHLSPGEVCQRLGTDAALGLSLVDVRQRLLEHGGNELPEPAGRSALRIWWEQFTATMVVVLIVAGLISLALRDFKDAIAIFAIVALNAVFGFAQEYRAEKAMLALRRLAAPNVKVRRGGGVESRPARELVPGDIILLEAGNIVGADCRLIEAANLETEEAALTGESAPVEKTVAALPPGDVPLAERGNMAWLGTMVTHGRGTGVVTETGIQTQLGQIAELLGKIEQEQTPLQRRLDELGRSLAVAALVLVAAIFGWGLLRGEDPKLMFLTSVSMAVAAVPEGLPAVVTIALALGAQRMLRRRALIRHLSAAETLGSVTVICSDKTGTLTENRMTVTALQAGGSPSGKPGDAGAQTPAITLLLVGGALCTDVVEEPASGDAPARRLGDPTELALAVAAAGAGWDKADLDALFPRVAELPFDSERKRMTTVHRVASEIPPALRLAWPTLPPGAFVGFTKGAAESVLAACDRQRIDGRESPLDETGRALLREAGERLAQTGQRVLGVAYRSLASFDDPGEFERGLVFIGMMGLSDPPRAEVKHAVQTCRAAGIRPLMITGDHQLTAQHVARELGIGGRVLTGAELEAMSAARLHDLVEEVSIYARVLPEHKFRIVEALQARGHIVSMTGDGVNDAPALKQADIGVAMGIVGTDVSKQASDMVLLDDNFTTIVAAVEEGRAIYDNIRKFIRYVLAGNLGEILVMLLGPLFGMPLPLLPLQILWINLASDGLNGLALSVEPPERNTMRRPPYPPGESIFAQGMTGHILRVGAFIGLLSFAVGWFFWRQQSAAWQTAAFATLAFAQIFQTLAVRSWRDSVFRLGFRSNKTAFGTVALSGGMTLAIIYLPFLQKFFGTVALAPEAMLTILALSTLVVWGIELEKLLLRRVAR